MKPEDKKQKIGLGIDTQKLKETLLNFIVPLVSLVLSLLIVIIYVYPAYKSIPLKKQELSKRVLLEKTLKSKYENLNKLVDFKSVLDENSDMVNKVLVSEAEVPKMLDQVNQLAVNSGMTLDRLSYSYGSTASGSTQPGLESIGIITVSLGSSFNYEQMVTFMESSENAARFLRVPSFRYAKGTSTDVNDTGVLSGSFSIESPYLSVQSNAVTDEPLDLDISSQDFVGFINSLRELKYYEFLNQYPEATEETPVVVENTETVENTEIVEEPVAPETVEVTEE